MKKLLAIFLAAVMVLTLSACAEDTDSTESTAATETTSTGPRSLEEVKNFSAKFTFTTPEETINGTTKSDTESGDVLATATLLDITSTVLMHDNKTYTIIDDDKGLPRATVEESKAIPSLTEEQMTAVINILTNKEDFTIGILKEFGVLTEVKLALAMYGIDTANVEKTVNALIDLFYDEEWRAKHFTVSEKTDGDVTTYSVSFELVAMINDLYTNIVTLLSMDEILSMIDPEQQADLFEGMPIHMDLTVNMTGGLPTDCTLKMDGTSVNWKGEEETETATLEIQFCDYNNTVINSEEVLALVAEAHGDYTECLECGDKKLYFRGYCESCALDKYCYYFCGNEAGEDGYCKDCFVPCRVCQEHAGYDHDGYCEDCYYKKYCYNDCGNEATHFYPSYTSYDRPAYCDTCFNPCEGGCGYHGEEHTDGYCRECYYKKYCYKGCGNEITHSFSYDDGVAIHEYGYCDECYTPCSECGENPGETYYDGYCSECYYGKHCYYCAGEATNFVEDYGFVAGFCDECYEDYLNREIAI